MTMYSGALILPGRYAQLVEYDPARIADLLLAPSIIWRPATRPGVWLAIPSLPQGHEVNPAVHRMAGVDVYGPVLAVARVAGRCVDLDAADLRWLRDIVGLVEAVGA